MRILSPHEANSNQSESRPVRDKTIGGGKAPFLLFALGVFATLVLYRFLIEREYRIVQNRFEVDANERIDSIHQELENELTPLWAMRAFFVGSEHVERIEFSSFAYPLLERFPGIIAIGWAPKIPRTGAGEHEEVIRTTDLPSYTILNVRDDQAEAQAVSREDIAPLLYVESFHPGYRSLIGFDLGEDIERRGILKSAAWSTELLFDSHGILSPTEGGISEALTAILPVYGDGSLTNQEALGYIIAVVSLPVIVENALHSQNPEGITISIGPDPTDNVSASWSEVYRRAELPRISDEEHEGLLERSSLYRLEQTRSFTIGGRAIKISYAVTEKYFIPHVSWLPALALLMGLAGSVGLAGYVNALKRRSFEVQALVNHRTGQLRATNEALHEEVRHRREVEETLRESENRFREMAENLRVAFWLEDIEKNRILYVNPAYEEIYSLAAASLEKDPAHWLNAVHPEDRPRIEHSYRTRPRDAENSYEYRIVRSDGSVRWIWDRCFPIFDAQGKVYRVGGICEDITQRKVTEEALREANSFLDSVFENIPNMVFLKEAQELRFIRINKAGEELLGYTREVLLGKNDYDLFPVTQAQSFVATDREVFTSGKLVNIREEPIQTKHGIRILHTKKIPIFDPQGRPRYLLGISEDITERKAVEAELLAAHEQLEQRVDERTAELTKVNKELERLALIVESSDDAIIGLTLNRQIISWNKGAQRLYGFTNQEVIGKPISILFSRDPALLHEDNEIFARIGRGESVDHYETVRRRNDGRLIHVSLNVSPIREENVISGYAVISRDITRRIAMERELHEHRAHLEALVEERTGELTKSQEQLMRSERMASIGALAAGIAHEINNPVGAILLSAENAMELQETVGSTEEATQLLRRTCLKIINNAKRCASIVKGVLQFAREEKSEHWPNDINLIINGALQLVDELIDTSQADINPELGNGLPTVNVNPLEIEQVLVNLVKNALDAHRNERIKIRVITKHSPGWVHLIVEDNGKGIPENVQKHVFDPFFTTRQHQGGTGLGLSIVHGIVESHGGKIEIESRSGNGTRVTIRLPQAADNQNTQIVKTEAIEKA